MTARRKVVEAGSSTDELFLQPWFVPIDISRQLRSLLPSSQLLKMRYYFDDYGCLRCGAREKLYGSNGMCKQCSVIVRTRIVTSLRKRFRKTGAKVDRGPITRYLNRLKRE
jgi:hypothetical protein